MLSYIIMKYIQIYRKISLFVPQNCPRRFRIDPLSRGERNFKMCYDPSEGSTQTYKF